MVQMAYIILRDDSDVNVVDALSLLTGGKDVWDGWPTKLCFSATVNRISIGRYQATRIQTAPPLRRERSDANTS